MEHIEGNKIIAIFDGYKFYPKDTLNGIKGVYRKEGKMPLLETEFKYHTSWDWLMPVWIKFKSLTFTELIHRKYHNQIKASFGNAILTGDIKNAWEDAVAAINWYNKNTQP